MQQVLTYLFVALYSVTILGVILVIITENRNPLKTLPWIIVLLLAPVVGLVFYFFFGQNLSKRRIISRRMRKRITLQLEENVAAQRISIPDEHKALSALLGNTLHAVPLYGSRITPYTDGRSKLEALLAEIAGARHHIHLQYYIFCDDAEILNVNRQYLQHDYYTDIITFDYCEDDRISGDLFISLDTVRSNAELFGKTYEDELHRVIIHGILHLCGINDKGPGEREIMEAAENEALTMHP